MPEPCFAGIDFESARLRSGRGDVPVEIGIACFAGGIFHAETTWSSHLLPAAEVYPGTGLRDVAALENAPPLLSLWPKIRDSLQGKILVAHGAGTERRFLRAFPGHGFGPWIDTLSLSRAVYPTLPSHSLEFLCNTFGIEQCIRDAGFDAGYHTALFDAAACVLLLHHLVSAANLEQSQLSLLSNPALRKYFEHRKFLRSAASDPTGR